MPSLSRLLLLALTLPGCLQTAKDQEELEARGAQADVDGDGVVNANDCDDRDAELGDARYDADCDGANDDVDCDPNDPSVGDYTEDTDCDGATEATDCNDSDASVGSRLEDEDCDGTVTADDCNDGDARMPSDDADCDGVATSADCDDGDATMPNNDADCDGAATAEDCDDGDDSVNPRAVEVCDGIDNDCDGATDDEDDSVDLTTGRTFYRDADEDGYGDPDDTIEACAAPSGYTADGTDCDDEDADAYPGALEIPLDGIDQDCDLEDAGFTPEYLAVGDLVITELMYDPSGSDTDREWFEVFNAAGVDVDLEGLCIIRSTTDHLVLGTLPVAAGAYVVFGIDSDPTRNGGAPIDYEYTDIALPNSGGELSLTDSCAAGRVLDSVAWDGGPSFPDPDGASMTLDPNHIDATDNDDGSHWCEGTSTFGSGDRGTPGAANDACL